MGGIELLRSPVFCRLSSTMTNTYKFQQLRVYRLALEYVDAIYELSRRLPEAERFNLQSQSERAATSIVLNIAEGSTGQSDAEQNRFLGMALRSYLETIACLDIVERRGYLSSDVLVEVRELGHRLFVKLQALRRSLDGGRKTEDQSRKPQSSASSLQSLGPGSSVSGLSTPVSRPRSLNPGRRSAVHPQEGES